MLKSGLKSAIAIIAVFIICTCIDPYTPKLKGYDSNLVVDGLITDANSSYTVRLTKTMQNQSDTPSAVSDATVIIADDAGNSSSLINHGNGIYKTDSTNFHGMIRRIYVLHIVTSDGKEYESEPCIMQSVQDIDSIYYSKDQELVSNNSQSQEGLRIYLDSKEGDNNQFYRWSFEETWKFKVPYPKKWDFNPADSSITSVADLKEYCWKNSKSSEILIYSNYSGHSGPVRKYPIFFIATDQSDRLMIEYSILVKQYSISQKEYNFWDNLTKVNTTGGDIFASQPFPVNSNIHNINNLGEKVLGYFQVSAVKEKRIFIPFSETVRLQLSFYNYPCERFERSANTPPDHFTWAELYTIWCITSTYYFIEPLYYSGTNTLEKMVFAKPECANCELTGTLKKPDFWIDLK